MSNDINNENLKNVLDENLQSENEETRWLLEYHQKCKVSKHVNVVTFGQVEETAYEEETKEAMVKPGQVIDEFTFYYLFCTINNIVAKESIAATQLLVLAKIMERPLNFSLPKDSKDGKLTQIAKELSSPEKPKTPNAIYQSVKRLRDKGYLVEIEDQLIVPNAKFNRVRNVVKKQLANRGYATFDYLFKCFIANQ